MTYRLPSLNTLRAFEAAARHLSFKAAADEIGVTAGAVSQQVRNLEQSLGIDLFRRLPHGLLLTTAGETYLPRITKAFEDLTTATEEIAPDMNGKKFTVGICPKAAKLLPSNWPLNDPLLKPHVRDRVKTSDVEQVAGGHDRARRGPGRLGGGGHGGMYGHGHHQPGHGHGYQSPVDRRPDQKRCHCRHSPLWSAVHRVRRC